jgi:ligand-binding SRPBCC domain-containing protein
MKIYTLYRKQLLPISMGEAWDFFSTPKNLNELTPEDMNFKILSGIDPLSAGQDQKTYAGQIIQYKITPFAGITMNWTTEITHCVAGQYFIDQQRFGPYKLWHHQHHFKQTDHGILMEDILHYALPLGWIGRLFAGKFIQKKVESIFDYRYKKLEKLFSKEYHLGI